MTRTGKIARLPRALRGQLNRRLQDGEPGTQLVTWLNALPQTQAVLKREFSGRPITEQNLSEWKQGGYLDWVRHEESCERVRRLAEQAEDLDEQTDGAKISDRLASVLAAELAGVAEKLLEEITDPKERWQRLREVLRELAELRREDHRHARLQVMRERWDEERDRLKKQKAEREIQQAKERALAPIFARLQSAPLAEALGGGESGDKLAALITAIQNDLPLPDLSDEDQSGPAEPPQTKPNQSESNQIQPNQTSSG